MTNPNLDDPVEVKAFLETLAHSLNVAGWTWPVRPLYALANRITETKVTWRGA